MTVAFDSASAIQVLAGSPLTFTYTPVGTPAGIIAIGIHRAGTPGVSSMTGATYGGQTMTEIAPSPVVGPAVSAGYLYFLNQPPAGPQDVVLTPTTAAGKRFVVISVTSATGQTAVVDADGVNATVDDPSVSLATGSDHTFVCSALHSFLLTVADITEGASYTSIAERDDGSDVCGFMRGTSIFTGGDVTVNWATSASQDHTMIAVAVKELATASKVMRRIVVRGQAVHRASRW